MTAIKTAVRNDGVLGTISNVVKMTSGGMGGPKKSGVSGTGSRQAGADGDDDSRTIRRKKITIKDDEGDDELMGDVVKSAMEQESVFTAGPPPHREKNKDTGR